MHRITINKVYILYISIYKFQTNFKKFFLMLCLFFEQNCMPENLIFSKFSNQRKNSVSQFKISQFKKVSINWFSKKIIKAFKNLT